MSKPEATTEPKASALPDSLLTALATPPNASAQKKQSGMTVSKEDLDDLELFQAASNFLAASMIFLTYAPIAQGCEGLTQDDIKSRLLGVRLLLLFYEVSSFTDGLVWTCSTGALVQVYVPSPASLMITLHGADYRGRARSRWCSWLLSRPI